MYKVLQILPTLSRGGLETFVMNVYRGLNTQDIQFDFLTYSSEGDYKDEIIEKGGKIFKISAKRDNLFHYCENLDIFFKEHSNEYNAVHLHDSVLSSIEPLKYAKKYHIPVRILHAHSSSVSGNKIHYLLHYLKKPFVHLWATHYFGCSDKANKWFYKYTGVFNKAMFVANGIDTSTYVYNEGVRKEIRKELGINPYDVIIGHVGRLMWIKNHSFLVDVFNEYHKKNIQSKLVIVGTGPLEEDIKKKISDLKLKLKNDVIFTGVRSDVNRILQGFDIFVMPSFYEGLPVVLVEAQASGLPVLCSDTISSDAELTESYYTLKLNEGCEKWSERLGSIISNHKRKNTQQEIIDKGFDIKNTILFLEEVYKSNKV